MISLRLVYGAGMVALISTALAFYAGPKQGWLSMLVFANLWINGFVFSNLLHLWIQEKKSVAFYNHIKSELDRLNPEIIIPDVKTENETRKYH